jgi:hypothetical protein
LKAADSLILIPANAPAQKQWWLILGNTHFLNDKPADPDDG